MRDLVIEAFLETTYQNWMVPALVVVLAGMVIAWRIRRPGPE